MEGGGGGMRGRRRRRGHVLMEAWLVCVGVADRQKVSVRACDFSPAACAVRDASLDARRVPSMMRERDESESESESERERERERERRLCTDFPF
jgi:hypothetical protein